MKRYQIMLKIFDGILVKAPFHSLPAGHPLENYLDENVAIRGVLKDFDVAIGKGKIIIS